MFRFFMFRFFMFRFRIFYVLQLYQSIKPFEEKKRRLDGQYGSWR